MRTLALNLAFTLFALALIESLVQADEIVQRTPVHRAERVLVAADPADAQPYLAFPAIIELDREILVSFKRGRSHANDAGASLDIVHIDKSDRSVSKPRTIAQRDDEIMQMGEWLRFSNGELANVIDIQVVTSSNRLGMHGVRSTDGGRTFSPLKRVGMIDGVEYGYPFDSITEGNTTWLLVMTFANLPGGKSVYPPRPYAGSVDVAQTDDNGRTWHFVRNLSTEFGNFPINESAFIRHGDGFLVTTRGYDDHQRLHRTDGNFNIQKQTDLTDVHSFIRKHIGRPRLFVRDGQVYLLGRNYTTSSAPMTLCLFRLDSNSLQVVSYTILDNASAAKVTDGYYACPYFRTEGNETFLNVVTYRGIDRAPPRIIELEYRWEEVR